MLNLNKLHTWLYVSSATFLVFEVLLLAGSDMQLSIGILETIVKPENSRYVTYLFLAPIVFIFGIIFILTLPSYLKRFWSILSSSPSLTEIATNQVRQETGMNHSVSHARTSGLFSRVINTGMWHTSTGILTKPIKVTAPLFKYILVVLFSAFKAFFIKGGLFELGAPAMAFILVISVYAFKYGLNMI